MLLNQASIKYVGAYNVCAWKVGQIDLLYIYNILTQICYKNQTSRDSSFILLQHRQYRQYR